MRPAEGPEPVTRRLTPRPGGGGVVSRTGLWERLGGSARAAAGRALERALDLAEPDGALLWFLLHPAPGLGGSTPALPPAGPRPLLDPLSGSEIRVLRYLPTHLPAPEIAGELSVSTSTVKTHLRNLYAKLGVHSRAEAVESARTLGLLAPSARSAPAGPGMTQGGSA